MGRWGLFLGLLAGIGFPAVAAVQVSTAPYFTSNAYADAETTGDAGNLLRLRFGDVHPSDGLVLLWSAGGEVVTSFQLPDQSNLLGEGKLACRFLLGDMVLETALGGRLNEYFTASRLKKTVDNEQFSHRAVEAGTQLRIDGESGSFWVGYGFSAAAFPDYDLDYSEHVLMLRAVVDLAADTALDVELQVGSRAYSERFLLDTAGTAGKESAGETTFAADCGLTQAFGAAFSMTLSLAYERLAGNGNLFFFGPGETELVEDGDEVLLEDFYSRHVFSVRLSGKYRLGPWLLSPEIGIQLVRYDSRPAFTAMDEPLSGTPQADTVPQAALAADWRLGETLTLVFRGTCARSFSNSARADHPLYTASLGVELDF